MMSFNRVVAEEEDQNDVQEERKGVAWFAGRRRRRPFELRSAELSSTPHPQAEGDEAPSCTSLSSAPSASVSPQENEPPACPGTPLRGSLSSQGGNLSRSLCPTPTSASSAGLFSTPSHGCPGRGGGEGNEDIVYRTPGPADGHASGGGGPDDQGAEDLCAVCLEPLSSQELQHTMHCKHRYRTNCLRQMRSHDLGSCPVCRAPITPGLTPAGHCQGRRPANEAQVSPLRIPEGLSMRDAIAYRAERARRAVQQRILQNQRVAARRGPLFPDSIEEEDDDDQAGN